MKKYHATIMVMEDDPVHIMPDGLEAIAYMKGNGKCSDRKKFEYPTFIMTDLKNAAGRFFPCPAMLGFIND